MTESGSGNCVVGVITKEVTNPRNDGSPGWSLYTVPLRLSRTVTPREAELIRADWDHPPQSTSRHRPGILEVRPRTDVVRLQGTTIEEVRDYHAATLRLVMEAVNAREVELKKEDARRSEEGVRRHEDHQANVERVAGEIDFS